MEHTPFPLGLAPGKPIRSYAPVNDNARPIRRLSPRQEAWLDEYLADIRERNELRKRVEERASPLERATVWAAIILSSWAVLWFAGHYAVQVIGGAL